MRKSSTVFHSKRNSGRKKLRTFRTPNGFFYTRLIDTCQQAHKAVHDKAVQLACNSLLTGLLNRAGVFA